MGQYCFARGVCRLLTLTVVVCNAAGRVGGGAVDTARQAFTVTSY